MTGEEITKLAFDEFVAWCKVHDPDGDWSVLESVGRYHEWCKIADRIVEECDAALAAHCTVASFEQELPMTKPTTEELDRLQFGKVLHQRPKPMFKCSVIKRPR